MFAGAGCSDVRNARRMRRVCCRLRSEWPGSSGQYLPELTLILVSLHVLQRLCMLISEKK